MFYGRKAVKTYHTIYTMAVIMTDVPNFNKTVKRSS